VNHDDVRIPVSVFQNKDDKHPQPHDLTWRALAIRLCRYTERPSKDGKAWSPVTYLPGTTRGKANVDQVFALVLDLDHGGDYWVLLEGRELVAHTTYQHTPAAPRWRVTLPLTRPVSGADWPAFWLRANAFFGGCVDPATKDASRLFYLPSCPPGAQHEEKWQHGTLLDPDSLPEVEKYEPPTALRGGQQASVFSEHLAGWAWRFCTARTAELANMPPASGRNSACNRVAYLLGGLVADPRHDLSAEYVVELLQAACAQNGLVADDGQRSVDATIRSGLESGLTRAWSPADQDPPQPPTRLHAQRNGTVSKPSPSAAVGLEAERMTDVENEALDWLWRGRFARGKATLLMGDPGLGKSLISHWLAAQVSVGAEWPDGGLCDKGAAVLMTIEDGLADTVKPRLVAAGADCDRIIAVRGVIGEDDSQTERMFALEEHLSLLEELVVRERANLVVMDPVSAYLGPNVNAHKESDVRRVLGPLQMMAERTNIVLLLIIHLTKGSGVAALYRATGSIAFPAACRIVLGVAADPNDEQGKRRLLLPIKLNVGIPVTGIGYRIETTTQSILPGADERDQPPILVWDSDPVLVDATVAMDRSGTVQELGALAECKRVLSQIMLNGRVLATEGTRQLKEAGASTAVATVSRARKELGIKAVKEGFRGPWWWEPPQNLQPFTRPRTNEYMETKEYLEPWPQGSQGSQDSQGSKDSQESEVSLPRGRAYTREAPAEHIRFCATCGRNLTPDAYEQHLPCPRYAEADRELKLCPRCKQHMDVEVYPTHLPCTDTSGLPEGLCPIHRFRFDMHDCDAL
jgi:hypothetical protein